MISPDKFFDAARKLPPLTALAGIVVVAIFTFNAGLTKFSLLGFHPIEIVVFVALIALLGTLLFSMRYRALVFQEAHRVWIPFAAFLLLGVFFLVAGSGRGLFAFHQSFIILSSTFFFVFAIHLKDGKALRTTLLCFGLAYSLIIGLKIGFFSLTGLAHADEPYRVRHDEIDVIFASLALLAFVLFSETFWKKSKPLSIVFLLLNWSVLFLTLKRTAFIGLALVFVVFIFLERNKKKTLRVVLVASILIVVSVVLVYLFDNKGFNQLAITVAQKLDVFHERNAVWRTTAWEMAWNKFLTSPFWGQGFGIRVIDSAIHGNLNYYPHNSYLSLAVSTGLLGLGLLLAALATSFLRFLKLLKGPRDSQPRPWILFFFFGYLYMLVFAFFNFVLEDPGQAAIFWFFTASPFFFDRKRSEEPQFFFHAYLGQSIFLVLLIPITIFAAFQPSQYQKSFLIYDPQTRGVIPEVWDPKETELVRSTENAIAVSLKPTAPDNSVTNLFWNLPADFYATVPGREAQYFLVVDFDAVPDGLPNLIFRRNDGGSIEPPNLLPNSSQIIVPIEALVTNKDLSLSDYYGFSLHLFHKDKTRVMRILKVEIKEIEQPYDGWEIFSFGNGTKPELFPDAVQKETQLSVDQTGATLRSNTTTAQWSALGWEISSYVLSKLDPIKFDLVLRFATPLGNAPFEFSVSDTKGGSISRPFLLKEVALPLSELKPTSDSNVQFYLNIPWEKHQIEWKIETLKIERRR